MVFTNLDALATLFLDKQSQIERLKNEVAGIADIEAINSTPEGAPSNRIAKYIPVYDKYKGSDQSGIVNVLEVIELPQIRSACQHPSPIPKAELCSLGQRMTEESRARAPRHRDRTDGATLAAKVRSRTVPPVEVRVSEHAPASGNVLALGIPRSVNPVRHFRENQRAPGDCRPRPGMLAVVSGSPG